MNTYVYLSSLLFTPSTKHKQGILVTRTIEASDPWSVRVAVSRPFEVLAAILANDLIVPSFRFLVEEEVLGDSNSEVCAGMLAAATKVIVIHGGTRLQELISTFERQHLRRQRSLIMSKKL